MTNRPKPGIVHLGLGAFYRAFALPWLEEAMAAEEGDWGVIGVSLRSPGVRDALAPRDFQFTSIEIGPDGRTERQITALRNVLVAPENPEAVLAAMADPATHVISLTVTEKGYCHDPATGKLNADHPDIQHDLTNPLPRSAPGFVLRALQRRFMSGTSAPTVLSCDNLPGNGKLLRALILDLAAKVDTPLRDWIAAEVTFPQTMIDRIVPATTADDIAAHPDRDAGLVLHEPFRQWVIEKRFAGPFPALDRVGVQFVADVAPYEEMKLRMLNGAHSALAYLGYLAGHHYVSDAVADPVFARFLRSLWEREIIPTLVVPDAVDLHRYADDLLVRFANPAIRHRTWQIAMDGSQKLPQRILGTLHDRLEADESGEGLLLVVAGWVRYVAGTDDAGGAIDVRDPLADELRRRLDGLKTPEDQVAALLGMNVIFDPALAARIEKPLMGLTAALAEQGARRLVERMSR